MATSVDLSSFIFSELAVDATEGGLLEGERFVLDQRELNRGQDCQQGSETAGCDCLRRLLTLLFIALGGYDIVTRHLASDYLKPADDRLVLSSPITSIIYSEDGVVVRTANNTCYRADYGICTFSLGVLQQAINGRAPVAFSPSMPKWKKESVVTNMMGIYTKIFYQFDQVFWPKNIQNFYFAHPSIRGYWGLWESLDFPGSPLEGQFPAQILSWEIMTTNPALLRFPCIIC